MKMSDIDMAREWVPALQAWRITASADGLELAEHFLPSEVQGWTATTWAASQQELACKLRDRLNARGKVERQAAADHHRQRLAECKGLAESA